MKYIPFVLADAVLRAEVRAELRRVIAQVHQIRQDHIHAWNSTEEGHPTPPTGRCDVCKRLEGEVEGLQRAIRRFDGRTAASR